MIYLKNIRAHGNNREGISAAVVGSGEPLDAIAGSNQGDRRLRDRGARLVLDRARDASAHSSPSHAQETSQQKQAKQR